MIILDDRFFYRKILGNFLYLSERNYLLESILIKFYLISLRNSTNSELGTRPEEILVEIPGNWPLFGGFPNFTAANVRLTTVW